VRARLLFELSNEDNLSILHELRGQPMKLHHVSKKLDFFYAAQKRASKA